MFLGKRKSFKPDRRRMSRTRLSMAIKVGAWLVSVVLGLGAPALVEGQSPVGISRELARERAQRVSDVRYKLHFGLWPKAQSADGNEELTFQLQASRFKAGEGLLLDFREGTVTDLTVNGSKTEGKIENGHIELPALTLKPGENKVVIDFKAPIATAGKAITRFEDKDDGSEYIYTLFVPMDAEMAFPCFDQPDIKGRFTLEVLAPGDWTVIANNTEAGPIKHFKVKKASQAEPPSPIDLVDMQQVAFAETKPISTYLFAFAAGPFRKVNDKPGLPGLYVRKSKLEKAQAEAEQVQQVTADGITYLSKYFDQPFPFPKYDMVMLPGFAYGGMEHAGATFLREESSMFSQATTHSERLHR
jgi:aminopeptidase N